MKEPNVSVAIITDKQISFELHGEFLCSYKKNKCSGTYVAKVNGNAIEIINGSESTTVDDNTIFSPSDLISESFRIKGVLIGKQFHWQRKENQIFLGSLKLIIEGDQVTAINVIPVEHYLESVISSEMNATSSAELLKAHAIISRSWLLAQIEKRKGIDSSDQIYESTIETDEEIIRWYDREDHTLYDVCADDHCQRYQGITKMYAHSAQDAVAKTSGIVLKYEDKICDTRFSKSCGGVTESFENVWEPIEHPYLKSIIDYKFENDIYDIDLRKERAAEKWIRENPHAFCNTNDEKILSQVLVDYDRQTTDFYRWKVEYKQNELAELIKSESGIDFGEIVDLIPVERGYSGRLIKLKIVGTKKTLTIGKELEIRKVLSKTHLYSSAIVIDKLNVVDNIPQKFVLTGAGWGHGVGLCQIGAAVMGEMGYSFDEILLHYFKGASIKKIYD
ncbi:Amidase enhancer [hydrothermal vent metagenome]|uniref:Amidase enhancer n=1 Tax=hydrothermal vent metagenome TaxID=652676 RepID=A0A3B1C826_9ZZZZ